MSGKHTPGPWLRRGQTDSIDSADGRSVCWVNLHTMPAEANARLISAAPDLLEALQEAQDFIDRHSEPWYTSGQALLTKVRAAITKAVQP